MFSEYPALVANITEPKIYDGGVNFDGGKPVRGVVRLPPIYVSPAPVVDTYTPPVNDETNPGGAVSTTRLGGNVSGNIQISATTLILVALGAFLLLKGK